MRILLLLSVVFLSSTSLAQGLYPGPFGDFDWDQYDDEVMYPSYPVRGPVLSDECRALTVACSQAHSSCAGHTGFCLAAIDDVARAEIHLAWLQNQLSICGYQGPGSCEMYRQLIEALEAALEELRAAQEQQCAMQESVCADAATVCEEARSVCVRIG